MIIMSEELRPFSEFCAAENVTISSRLVDNDPNMNPVDWRATAFAWSTTLRFQGRTMTTVFYMGAAHYRINGRHKIPSPPSVADVLSSLIMDANSVYDVSFEEWADEMGLSSDSRNALKTYLHCQKLNRSVRILLGDRFDAFAEMSVDW